MTNTEAITKLTNIAHDDHYAWHPSVMTAFGMAVDALRGLPSAQPEIIRCKDCGKREVCRTSTVWAVAPGDDWFCADAERRTE